MKRATHYGVAADKQEVEHLRSEVSRLRTHITDMGDKIGQLTSLVDALAVDRKPSAVGGIAGAAPAAAGGGKARGGNGSSSGVGASVDGACSYDSFVFGSVGGGGDVFQDAKFSHPAGLSASAAVPVQAVSSSRKRKLVGLGGVLDGSGGECFEALDEDCGVSDGGGGGGDVDGDVAMPWPAGAGGEVKPEIMDEGMACSSSYLSSSGTNKGPWAPGLVSVKQEMIDERACRPPWPGSCSTSSLVATSGGGGGGGGDPIGLTSSSDIGAGVAAAAAASSATPACSLMPPPSDMSIGLDHPSPGLGSNGASGGGCGDFTLYRTDSGGFSDQFLSFGSPTSPTANYTFPDRGRGCSMASSAGNSGSGSRCGSVAGDSASNAGGVGSGGDREAEGDSTRTNVVMVGDSSSSSCTEGGISGCSNRSQGAQPDVSSSSPMTLQPPPPPPPPPPATEARLGASHMEELLQNNLESLPADSRTKVHFTCFPMALLFLMFACWFFLPACSF